MKIYTHTRLPTLCTLATASAAALLLMMTASAAPPVAPERQPGAIPVRFSLDAASYVTLVIEDAAGNRVRNLIAESQLPAGDNLLYLDGYDDGTRDEKGNLLRKRVAAGQYRVRGLTHNGIHLSYEFPIYSGGKPSETK